MSVYDVAGVPTTSTTATKSTGSSTLKQADFLKLMTAQMQSQDPMDPVDNKEMIAQMAQFSSLAGINDINTNLSSLGTKLDAILAAQKTAAAPTSQPPADFTGRIPMSFYTSLNGLKNSQTQLDVVSHNIANAETTGFKKSTVQFADIVAGSAYSNPKLTIGVGASVEAIQQNFALGPLQQTGSALDIAINGDGFFSTVSAQSGQTLFTRNGNFQVDQQGFIHDGSENRLQVFPTDPTTGAVTSTTPISAQIPAQNNATPPADFAGVAVNENGNVVASYADGTNMVIGKVALASFISPTGLKQMGSSNWTQTGLSGTPTYGQPGEGAFGDLLSGSLERSNVDLSDELVGLITAQRNFQANAKAIDTATQISQTIINLRT